MAEAQLSAEQRFQTQFRGRHVVPGHVYSDVERHGQVIALLAEVYEDFIDKSAAERAHCSVRIRTRSAARDHRKRVGSCVHVVACEVEARGKRLISVREPVSINRAPPIHGCLMPSENFRTARDTIPGRNGSAAEAFFKFDVVLSPASRHLSAGRIKSLGFVLSFDAGRLAPEDRALDEVAKLRAAIWFSMGDVAPFDRTVVVVTFSGQGPPNPDPRRT